MLWVLVMLALMIGAGCERKSDCRFAAETLCRRTLDSFDDSRRDDQGLYEFCVADKIMKCGGKN